MLELSITSLAAGLAVGAAGVAALPALLAWAAVRLERVEARPGRGRLVVALAIAGIAFAVGLGRGRGLRAWPALDGEPGEVRGARPAIGKLPFSGPPRLVRVLGPAEPTERGWRARVQHAGGSGLLYGAREAPPPSAASTLVARCRKSRERSAGPETCTLLRAEPVQTAPAGLSDRVARLRLRTLATWIRVSPGAGGRIAVALATGARRLLPPAIRDRLARLGVLHLWAVSGLHLLLAGGCALLLLRRAAVWVGRGRARPAPGVLAALGAVPVVLLYGLFCGAGASAVRAGIAFSLFALLRWARLPARGRTLVLLTVAAELTLPVEHLLRPGSLLSHGATVAIMIAFTGDSRRSSRTDTDSGQGWRAPLARLQRLLRPFGVALRAGLAATLGTAAFQVAFFGSLTPLGILLGGALVPFVSLLLLPLCLLAAAVAACGAEGLATPLIQGASSLSGAVASALERVDIPGLRIGVDPGLAPGVAVVAILALRAWRSPSAAGVWRLWLPAAAAAIATAVAPGLLPRGEGTTVTALRVGHADAYLIRSGEIVVLVDAGPGWPDGRGSRVSPERLRRLGVHHIDLLVLTHRHPDHFGGAYRIVADLPVADCVRPRAPPLRDGRSWAHFEAALERAGLGCRPLGGGEQVQVGRATLELLHPGIETGPPGRHKSSRTTSRSEENGWSMIARLRTPEGSLWITGDAPVASEKAAMGAVPTPTPSILLVPHHGSRSSSSEALLDTLAPGAAIVSQRRPVPADVAARYRHRRIPLCGTAPGGTVRIRLLRSRIILPIRCSWDDFPPGRSGAASAARDTRNVSGKRRIAHH